MDYIDVIKKFDVIGEVYILIDTFEIYLESQVIKINISKDYQYGLYSYTNSHHYQGAKQAGPYMSSSCTMIASKEEALEMALKEVTLFYDPYDYDAVWIRNEDF